MGDRFSKFVSCLKRLPATTDQQPSTSAPRHTLRNPHPVPANAQPATRDFLLVFMRYPEAGRVKTRLAREIGPERAAASYEKLLRRTLGVVSDFKRQNPGARILLFHTPEDPPGMLEKRFRGPWEFISQEGEHLGERMENALFAAFSLGAEKAVLIGSDIADIAAPDLEEAFRTSGGGVAALGPAADGGFYLIGLDRPCAAPFRFAEWGTEGVFSRTARALSDSGLRVETVARRSDVDRPEDLPRLDRDPVLGNSLSVIMPSLSTPERLAPLVDYLECGLWPGDEIIVVQGCASGKTGARRISDTVLHARSQVGRGIQQNAGATLARGDIFFFLHDDTIPPPDFAYHIRAACARSGMSLGCFRLAFCPDRLSMGLVAKWANLRTTLFKLPYGDQGLFCSRDTFERAGGFRLEYLLEDVDLVRRCRKLGRLLMLPIPVHSSSERYLRKGVLSASFENHLTMLLFHLGVSSRELYSIYYRQNSTPRTQPKGQTHSLRRTRRST
ncbi:MAG: TIGR04282 family arsenosugar biosynthesis glycosyltransferase [Syntrophobacteraceae bacterium]